MSGSFSELAAELAALPGATAGLLTDHADNGTGHCRTCTRVPGYGTRDVPAPCSLRQLAEHAARLHPVWVPR